jgi:hypothetical protein
MHRWFLLLLFLTAGAVAAPKLDIQGLDLPEFDSAGRIVRKLTARTATGDFDTPQLREAVVLFFPAGKPDAEPFARLFLDDAVLQRKGEVVLGEGKIRLVAAQGTADGIGYVYHFKTNRLFIRRAFRLETPAAILESREADIVFKDGPQSGEWVVAAFEARGDVLVTPLDKSRYKFDRARGDKATYRAEDQIIRLQPPVHVWHEGKEDVIDAKKEMEVDLKK